MFLDFHETGLFGNDYQWPIVVAVITNDATDVIADDGGGSKVRSVLLKLLELAAQGL